MLARLCRIGPQVKRNLQVVPALQQHGLYTKCLSAVQLVGLHLLSSWTPPNFNDKLLLIESAGSRFLVLLCSKNNGLCYGNCITNAPIKNSNQGPLFKALSAHKFSSLFFNSSTLHSLVKSCCTSLYWVVARCLSHSNLGARIPSAMFPGMTLQLRITRVNNSARGDSACSDTVSTPSTYLRRNGWTYF